MYTNLQIVLILHMEENQSLLRTELELVHLLHGTTRNLHLQFQVYGIHIVYNFLLHQPIQLTQLKRIIFIVNFKVEYTR